MKRSVVLPSKKPKSKCHFVVAICCLVLLAMSSCKKCKRCSYTYSAVTTKQGINGEEVVVQTVSGKLNDKDGAPFGEECIKRGESFTIEQFYQAKKDTTALEDFDFSCTNF